jgi:hypothetical protein
MNILYTRLQQKHDIPANWEKSNLIPLAGEIIVYDDRYMDSDYNEVIVASTVRYKIGDGVTPVKNLPFADTTEIANKLKELSRRVDGLTAVTNSTITPVDGTITITNKSDGSKAIGVAIAPRADNALVAVDGGLFVPSSFPEYKAGTGIEVTDNSISVKLADNTHGLVAVNGALTLNLASRKSDGAMSKEDKRLLDSIPHVYEARKYEISNVPTGTLVDYSDYEIRVMCPVDAVFTKQNVGSNGNPDMYYMTFKAYAPEGAVSFKEGDRGVIIDEMHTFNESASGIDEYGRSYSVCWLALASYNAASDTWNYFGKNSNINKYIGWDYCVEWYDKNGNKIGYDDIRINLSNENCHNVNKPYYMANYLTSKDFSWGDI